MVGISREAGCENLLFQLLRTSDSTTCGLKSLSGIGFGDVRDYLQQMLLIYDPVTSQHTLKFTCSCSWQFLLRLLAPYLECHGSCLHFCLRSFPQGLRILYTYAQHSLEASGD